MAYGRLVATFTNPLLSPVGPTASMTLHTNEVGALSLDGTSGDHLDLLEDLVVSMQGIYSPLMGTTVGLKVYDLSDAEPREAVNIREITIAPSGGCLPGEVAVNVHYRGARVLGVPSQRARGTIQLGPLSNNALDPNTGHVTNAAVDTIAQAFGDFADAAAPARPWVVGSELHGFVPVVTAYLNNEFGTVGSRQFAVSYGKLIVLP